MDVPRPLPGLQKIADAADFFGAPLYDTLCNQLRMRPHLAPRQWEYGMAYRAMEQSGLFHERSAGIGFGCGREPLIFAVAGRVAHLTVTDLYSDSTEWSVARTGDSRAFVLAEAPEGFDGRRIDVQTADMRRTGLAGGQFDFAYSISSIEHIGGDEDFVAHLSEVRRLLKPGGAYVLTTELRIDGLSSHPVRGNYAFSLDHLMRLIERSGLSPEPAIDCRLHRISANEPCEHLAARAIDAAAGGVEQMIVRETGGLMSVPVLLILRPGPFREPDVVGSGETSAWLRDCLDRRTATRLTDWCAFNPFAALASLKSEHMDFWPAPAGAPRSTTVFGTRYTYFGDGEIEVRVTLVTSPHAPSTGTVAVAVMSWSREDIADMVPLDAQFVTFGGASAEARHVRLRVRADRARSYSVYGLSVAGAVCLSDVVVMARRAAATSSP